MSDQTGSGWWLASDGRWYPPPAPIQRPLVPLEPLGPKVKKPWYKRPGIMIPLCVFGVFVALTIWGSTLPKPPPRPVAVKPAPTSAPTTSPQVPSTAKPTTTAMPTTTAKPATTVAPTTLPPYPGRQKGDQLADGTGIQQVSGYQINAGGWKENPADSTICGVVALRNGTNSPKPYDEDQWQMQTPNGQVVGSSLLYSTLGLGNIIANGTAVGNVCFRETEALHSGQFVFIFTPSAGSSTRGIWLANL